MDSDEAGSAPGVTAQPCMVYAALLQWDEIIRVSSVIVSGQITRPSAAVVPKPWGVKAITEPM